MSKPNERDIAIKFLVELEAKYMNEWNREHFDLCRRLIEAKPRVTREFVIRKANEYNLPHFWLFQFVRELGIKIENEEEEK